MIRYDSASRPHPSGDVTFGNPLAATLPFASSMFLHGGWLHLIGNLWTLWIFGDNVEDRLGHVRYLIFYLAGGLAASLVHICLRVGQRGFGGVAWWAHVGGFGFGLLIGLLARPKPPPRRPYVIEI